MTRPSNPAVPGKDDDAAAIVLPCGGGEQTLLEGVWGDEGISNVGNPGDTGGCRNRSLDNMLPWLLLLLLLLLLLRCVVGGSCEEEGEESLPSVSMVTLL